MGGALQLSLAPLDSLSGTSGSRSSGVRESGSIPGTGSGRMAAQAGAERRVRRRLFWLTA